jgi:hypothetical protein
MDESSPLLHTDSSSEPVSRPVIDPTEDTLGISTYLVWSSTEYGFSAISKARYSDFIVHEGKLLC